MIEPSGPSAPEAIAIVGMTGRFPRARTLHELWARLAAGQELVTFFSDEELVAAGVQPELVRDRHYVKARAVLEDAELFDAAFFGINPREAELMDPQQRVFLECAWEALEDAGYDPERYPGAIGVYAGLSMNNYLLNNLARNPEVALAAGGYQLMITGDKDFLATRASYKLNLRGPSLDVQTACSTSLVAVQLACQSLLSYQCDLALAGGVSVGSPRAFGHLYQPGMILSPDGHCRAFDASGRGIVAGEGAGLVVLKRLSEALAEGDTIHAIIRGAAINNDGAQKVGFTAPSVEGQAEVIAMAHAMAGVSPDSITYVEAHGTGTELGDPIEVAALTQAFRAGTERRGYCALGSVKTNLGHLDAAAGIAGLLKTVLALEHQHVPPSLHFRTPNPNIDFASSPFYVNTEPRPWTTPPGVPRRAGVSSFGIGGTNAHVVVEEAPPRRPAPSARPSQLLPLSARTPSALERATDALAEHLRRTPDADLADVAYTLQVGRRTFGTRRVAIVAGGSLEEAAAVLERRESRRVISMASDTRNRPAAFLFTGQGAQYVNMARELYTSEPAFAREIDRCAALLEPELGLDLRRVLYPAAEDEAWAAERLAQTGLAQPALFVVEYALARLWMSWGVRPRWMLGHSLGEYVAACLAGVFELEDALRLVAGRGRLMQALPGGSMLSVSLGEPELEPLLGPDLAIAAVNGPRLCVVSGPTAQVHALKETLDRRDVGCRLLHTSHAFHSPMMDPVLEPFRARIAQVALRVPSLPFISNLTATWITPEQATDPAYWVAHLRSTVRFAGGLGELLGSAPELALLEMGPGSLASLANQNPAWTDRQVAIASLRHPYDARPDHTVLTEALGRAWLAGVEVDWPAVHAPEARQRVGLPTYPFERQRYWVEPQTAVSAPASLTVKASVPPRGDDVSSWFYQPSWSRQDRAHPAGGPDAAVAGPTWLIFDDGAGLGDRLATHLIADRQRVVRVTRADTFGHPAAERYELPAADRDSYRRLLQDLRAAGSSPERIVHLWSAAPIPPQTDALGQLEPAQDEAFYSLMYLAQALAELDQRPSVQLDVIASGVCEVTGDEPLVPARALLLGPCRVIPQEFPGVTCRVIDVPAGAEQDARLLAAVALELGSPVDQPLVAFRGGHRWLPTYAPLALERAPGAGLHEGGVYLITGGLGGIGLELAEYLATAARARLVLLGRHGLPERVAWSGWLAEHGPDEPTSQRIRKVQALEAAGAEVLVVRADVCDAAAVQAAVEQTHARFGAINGVIHAAGVAGGGIIPLKSRAMAEQVLAPKVLGTATLDRALRDEPLDFFVVCSSVTAILGGPGQVDYCAANAFLDAFGHARNRRAGGTLAINWAAWQEVGMAVQTQVAGQLQAVRDANLQHGLRSAEGREAFARVLASRLGQVVVSPQDFTALLGSYERARLAGRDEEAVEEVRPAAPHGRPPLSTPYAAPRTELEAQVAAIWQSLLGIADVGVHDSFFDLGGHSLLATQLLGRLQRHCGVELPLRSIFESPTVAELAERIETSRSASAGVAERPPATDDRVEIEL